MAFKQGNNPLSRKTSPMRTSPFRKEASVSMEDLKKMSAKQDAESKAQALKLPQIEKPGFDYEMDQDMSYPGGERGRDYDEEGTKDGMSRKGNQGDHKMTSGEYGRHLDRHMKTGGHHDDSTLKEEGMSRKESPLNVEGGKSAHTKSTSQKADFAWETHKQGSHHKVKLGQKTPKPSEEEIAAMSEKNSKGVSRKDAAYFGLGKDDGKARKTKKADKTAKQVIKMQNKRSSVKNVYLGDPDDLEGEMVRTADKPAGKREKRKVKKLNKTKDQLGVSRKK